MKKLIYHSGLYAASAAVLKGGGLLVSLWMARSLEVSEYALFGVLFAIQVGVVTFGVAGIFEAAVGLLRKCNTLDERRNLFIATNHVLIFTIGVVIVFASVVGTFASGPEIDVMTLASVLLSGGLLAYVSLQSQMLRLEERHIASLAFSFVLPAIGLIFSGVLFWIMGTAESFFIGSVIGLIFSTFVAQGMGLFYSPYSINNKSYQKEIFLRLAPFFAISIFGWMGGYGNSLVIAKLFESTDVAQFTFAMSIGAIMQMVASALNQVWGPHFFNIVHSEPFEIVEERNRKFFFIQSLVLGCMAMVLLILLPPALKSMGGNLEYYSSMEIEFFFLFSGYIILIPWWHCNNYFLAYDRGRSVMNIVLTTSAMGVTLWLALMWLFGSIGIYIGFFAQMLFRSIGISIIATRSWPLKVNWTTPLAGIMLAGVGLFIGKI